MQIDWMDKKDDQIYLNNQIYKRDILIEDILQLLVFVYK